MKTIGALYYAPVRSGLAFASRLSWAVRSSRYDDVFYTVTRHPDGTWECDCPAGRYESRADGECKHIDEKKADFALPAPDFPELEPADLCWH